MSELAEVTKLAHQGNLEAQYHLTLCYLNGKGFSAGLFTAMLWFKKGAAKNFPLAQFQRAYQSLVNARRMAI